MNPRMLIKFLNPDIKLPGEKRSKLLNPSSPLYKYLENKRNHLISKYPIEVFEKRMDFHIELIAENEKISKELLIKRAQELENMEVELNLSWMASDSGFPGYAVVLLIPNNSFRVDAHITVAYFSKGKPN